MGQGGVSRGILIGGGTPLGRRQLRHALVFVLVPGRNQRESTQGSPPECKTVGKQNRRRSLKAGSMVLKGEHRGKGSCI